MPKAVHLQFDAMHEDAVNRVYSVVPDDKNLSKKEMYYMKKNFFALGILLLLIFALVPTTVIHANEISVTVNGERVNFTGQQPVIVDGRTLVPVRGVFEMMGFEVDWEPDRQRAILISDEHVVSIYIGYTTFVSNDVNHGLDVPAQIINGSTMLPIRAVLESVGYSLDWDESTSTVVITSADNPHPFATALREYMVDYDGDVRAYLVTLDDDGTIGVLTTRPTTRILIDYDLEEYSYGSSGMLFYMQDGDLFQIDVSDRRLFVAGRNNRLMERLYAHTHLTEVTITINRIKG